MPIQTPATDRTLASGDFRLPAATAFGEPAFHEVLTSTQQLPADLRPSAGLRLVLRLRNVRKPEITCSRDQPLSGCATVDWSDARIRRNEPPSGVFENILTLQLASGPRTFYLSEAGVLNDQPDPLDPG